MFRPQDYGMIEWSRFTIEAKQRVAKGARPVRCSSWRRKATYLVANQGQNLLAGGQARFDIAEWISIFECSETPNHVILDDMDVWTVELKVVA